MGFSATTHARDTEEFLIRYYDVVLEVECINEAILQMRTLPGLELSSRINLVAGLGQALRVVDSRDMNLALNIIQDMGSIISTESSTDNNFARWVTLRREIDVRQHEYNSLMELLHASTLMSDFEIIETRLNVVIHNMDRLRGDLQGIEFQMGTTLLNISLRVQAPEHIPEPEPIPEIESEPEVEISAFMRIKDTFLASARITSQVLQGVAMVLAYVSIPLIVLAIVSAATLWSISRKKKKGDDQND